MAQQYGPNRFLLQAASEVKVRDRSGALKFIQSSRGCLVRDLAAAYPGAAEDVAHLKSEGLVWVLPAEEKEQNAVFPRDKPPMIAISSEFLKLWHEIEASNAVQQIPKQFGQVDC